MGDLSKYYFCGVGCMAIAVITMIILFAVAYTAGPEADLTFLKAADPDTHTPAHFTYELPALPDTDASTGLDTQTMTIVGASSMGVMLLGGVVATVAADTNPVGIGSACIGFFIFFLPFFLLYFGSYCSEVKIGENAEGEEITRTIWQIMMDDGTIQESIIEHADFNPDFPPERIAFEMGDNPKYTPEGLSQWLSEPENYTTLSEVTIDEEGFKTIKLTLVDPQTVEIDGIKWGPGDVEFTQNSDTSQWNIRGLNELGVEDTKPLMPNEFEATLTDQVLLDANEANVNAANEAAEKIRLEEAEAEAEAEGSGEEAEGSGEEAEGSGEEAEEATRRRLSTGGGEDTPSDARRLFEIDKPATSITDSNILLLVPMTLAVGWLCYAIRKRYKRYVRPRLHSLRLVVIHMSRGPVQFLYGKQSHE